MICDKGIEMKFVLLLLLGVFVWGDEGVRCIEREREALVSFKNSLTDESGILSSWRSDECCNWYGVVCSNTTDGHVIRLELGTGDFVGVLGGKVSSSLLELHHLNYLDLSYNDFGGGRIPEFIGSMKQLRHLYLRESEFSGIVPPQLGNLTNLRTLALSRNSLKSDNLNWLSSLSLLSFLTLGGNDFGGHPIPEFIGSMKKLEQLYLWGSNFSGVIPPQLGNLTNLLTLDLSYNSLKSQNLNWLSSLSLLSYLSLGDNDFGGHPIPKFIGSMKKLEQLYLWGSNFSGVIPPQLGNLTNLLTLDLSYNSLKSQNLNWLSNLSSLSHLYLSDSLDLNNTNWLQQILNLHSLQELHLQSCNISDVNPSFVNSSSPSLSFLDLSNNHLTSSALDWISNVSSSLVKVDLSQNALGGLSPNALERLSHVEHLDLSSNMLEGEIPKALGNLSHLRVLVLYNNELRGDLNEFIGNLSSKGLEILDLASNQFNGSLPDLTAFSALTELYLDNNKFTGSMPHSVGQLSKLEVLDVSDNSLNGTVSETHLIKLANLKMLDLSFNSLILRIAPDWSPPFQLDHIFLAGCDVGHSFPKWIQTQRTYTTLDLSSSGIKGEIPKWLWSLSPSIENLFLSDNQINGTLPDLSSTPIPHIDLRSNEISGPIPLFHPHTIGLQLSENMLFGSISSICTISHLDLESLDLSNNQLSGEIPNCWEKMPNLFSLNLANNSFSGALPHSFGSLHNLVVFQLSDNNFSGEFPSTMRFCEKLQLIDVGRNHLSGYVPLWIGVSSRHVVFLIFQRNEFYGTVPPRICHLTWVRILDISSNNLSGKIPDCFNNFTILADTSPSPYIFGYMLPLFYNSHLPNPVAKKVYREFSSLRWKGQEREYRRNLNLLKLIDFSSNRLSGTIPHSLSSMKGLISLNLSRNSLTGNIIPDIGQMEMLECLDLSHNQLSGEIPMSLAQLHFLDVLDLSDNNLSGKIPSSTQLQTFNMSSYAGNNGLCGSPLELCPEDRRRPPIPTQGEEHDGLTWSLSSMQGLCISIGFGFIVGFWGAVGSLVLKKSWRYAYFNLLDDVADWFYVRVSIFLSKWRKS